MSSVVRRVWRRRGGRALIYWSGRVLSWPRYVLIKKPTVYHRGLRCLVSCNEYKVFRPTHLATADTPLRKRWNRNKRHFLLNQRDNGN